MRPSAVFVCALVLGVSMTGGSATAAPVRASKELAQLRLLIEKEDFKGAFAKGRALLAPFEETYGADSIEVADLLDEFLFAWLRMGGEGTPQMLALAERALAVREAKVPGEDPSLARPLRQLAAVLRGRAPKDLPWKEQQKRSLAAVGHLKRALAIESVGRWNEDPTVLSDFAGLGSTLVWGVGSYDAVREGLQVYEQLAEIHEKARGKNSGRLVEALHGRASAEWRLGDFDAALRDYRRALEIVRAQSGPKSPGAVSMMNSLANTLVLSGEYGESLKLHEAALATEESTTDEEWKGKRSWWISNTLNSLGLLHFNLGLLEEARAFLERGMRIEDHVSSIETNLGRVVHALGDLPRARSLFEAELVKSPDSPWVCSALGDVLAEQGERGKAMELYRRALVVIERDQGATHFYLLDALEGLARLEAQAGNLEEANRLLLRGLAIAQKTFGEKSARAAEFLAELARVHAKAGDAKRALEEALRAESISRDHLRLTSRSLSEREALRFGAARTSTMDLLLDLAAGEPGAAPGVRTAVWDALVRSRALVLDEMVARHVAIDSTSNREVARLADALTSARARLARLVILGPQGQDADLYRQLVETATVDKDRAERELAARSERFNRDLARAGLGLSEALAALPPEAALVGYGRYETDQGPRYLAFVGATGKQPSVIALGAADRVDSLVSRWREAIARSGTGSESARASYLEAGGQLRAAIWDPLAQALAGARRVFVVPDGSIGLVSLAALPADEGAYLIERGPPVHYVSAERDLAASSPPSAGRGMLALGAPEYDTTSTPETPSTATRGLGITCLGYADLSFAPLPETKTEAEEVAAVWARSHEPAQEVVQLTGSAATEAAFKRLAPGRRVVHLATHGFFLGEDCPSALPRTRGIGGLVDRENAPRPALRGENPLLLAGLALAGANKRSSAPPGAEDGVLTAEEIAGIDLSSADWVVLSGCETGVGTIAAGEGVLGLRRAVALAGGKTLIMSLWPVEDQAAREWMGALYRARWVDGLDTVDAVRAASLEVLRARRKEGKSDVPFFWGPFIAAGTP